jgi:hypothetical protein
MPVREKVNYSDEAYSATLKLLAYCKENDWAGYDPYDALNSRIFSAVTFLDFDLPRLILTQALKRSPVNIRPFLLVPKKQNPKAMGLFLASMIKLSEAGVAEADGLIDFMIERLIALRSPDVPYWSWGYSFPWQMRTKIVPRGAPNLVCTLFVAESLLDAYEKRKDPRCLAMAASAAEYIVNDLYWAQGDSIASFSYPLPTIQVPVHNANFLAAAFLCRVSKHTGDSKFTPPALKVARYSVGRQKADGSWFYGEAPTQQWIDNFHTGYNLGALQSISQSLGTAEFDDSIRRGFAFYMAHFFREDGASRYFHNRTYPIDIHCVAQSIITLLTFRELAPEAETKVRSILNWTMKNMWDERGFFYYRVLRTCTIRTPYMRWSEAWMLLALATVLCASNPQAISSPASEVASLS